MHKLERRTHAVSGKYESDMGIIDLHTHSNQTDGWLDAQTVAERMESRAVTGFAGLDHDSIRFGHEVRELFARQGLGYWRGNHFTPYDAVVGSEITAVRKDGSDVHIGALFIEDNVKPYQSISKTVERIVALGGIVYVVHPGHPDPRVCSMTFAEADEIARSGTPTVLETYNASIEDLMLYWWLKGYPNSNKLAQAHFQKNKDIYVAEGGGSDEHYRRFARGATAHRGDIKESLLCGKTIPVRRSGIVLAHEAPLLFRKDHKNHKRLLLERDEKRAKVEQETEDDIIHTEAA